jgi:hypothetical protein
MTIRQAIERLDELVPNMVTDEVKVSWLHALDSRLYRDVWLSHAGTDAVVWNGYQPGVDMDTEMLAPSGYEDIYPLYMEMMIHATNGEIKRYNNAAQRYNATIVAMMDDINRNHMPKSVCGLRLW